MIGNLEEAHTVLRVIIDNMLYPITIDILKMVSIRFLLLNFIQQFMVAVVVWLVIFNLVSQGSVIM